MDIVSPSMKLIALIIGCLSCVTRPVQKQHEFTVSCSANYIFLKEFLHVFHQSIFLTDSLIMCILRVHKVSHLIVLL